MKPFPAWFRLPALLLLTLLAYVLPAPGSGMEWLGLTQDTAPSAAEPVPVTLPTLPQDTLRLFERSRAAVVRVGSADPGTHTVGLGTGFFVTPQGQVLTASHVVSEGRLFQVQTLGGQRYQARLTAFDAASDVALLQVTGKGPFPYLALSPRPPQVGEHVLAIGNSGGDFLQPRLGHLLRLEVASARADFPQGTLQMDARLAPGDSGGPIINDLGQVCLLYTSPSPRD